MVRRTIAGAPSVMTTRRPWRTRKSASSPVPPPNSSNNASRGKARSSARRTARRWAATLAQFPNRPVERGGVGALEQHGRVLAGAPVPPRPELLLDPLVEFRARQRVGDGDSNVVGLLLPQEIPGQPDVGPLLPGVAQQDEPGGA